MAARVRVQSFEQTVGLAVDRLLTPEAQGRMIADAARAILADAEAQNTAALGHKPPHKTFVDGRQNAPLESVKPSGGSIVFEFQLIDNVLIWVSEMLVQHSPMLTGAYTNSFLLYADGVEVDIAKPAPVAESYVFLNSRPYSRKIERGLSNQAPDGVFHAVAVLAGQRFNNQATIRFSYQSPISAGAKRASRESRTPCIIVNPR